MAWIVILAHALVGAWLIASAFVFEGAPRGGGSEIVCGALAILTAAALAVTRIRRFRWTSLLIAFWLLAWTMFHDLASGALTLSNTLAAFALLALAGLEGTFVSPCVPVVSGAPAKVAATPRGGPQALEPAPAPA